MREGQGAGVRVLTVEQAEDLRSDGGGLTAFAGEVWRRRVEYFQLRIRQAAGLQRVEGATMTLFREWVWCPGRGERAHDLSGLHGGFEIDLGPVGDAAERGIEFAGGGEHRIAQLLGGQPAGLEDGVARAGRILVRERFQIGMRGAAAIRLGVQNDSVHGFEAPTFLHESGREPVEQFRMRGLLAGAAKVVWIARDGLVKMPEPDSVHDGAGRERILRAGNPIGEGHAAAFDGVGNGRLLRGTQHAEHAGLYLFAGAKRVATGEHASLFQLACGHPVNGHAQWPKDGLILRRAARVHGECVGFVAIKFPPETFEPFAGHPLQSELFWREADQLGWEVAFRYASRGEGIARGSEEVRILPKPLRGSLLRRGRFASGLNSGVPRGRVLGVILEPALRVLHQHGIELREHGLMFRERLFQIGALLEALCVFHRQERRGTFGELGGRKHGLD